MAPRSEYPAFLADKSQTVSPLRDPLERAISRNIMDIINECIEVTHRCTQTVSEIQGDDGVAISNAARTSYGINDGTKALLSALETLSQSLSDLQDVLGHL